MPVLVAVALICGCVSQDGDLDETHNYTAIYVKSTFANDTLMDRKYTCDGENIPPPLLLSGIPSTATSISVIVEDHDAPMGAFVHWVVWNLPVNEDYGQGVYGIGVQGRNDFNTLGYGGPCPPPGKPHHYVFTVYALDSNISLDKGATRDALLIAMKGHISGKGELVGLYGR